jgi:hypothetical protein
MYELNPKQNRYFQICEINCFPAILKATGLLFILFASIFWSSRSLLALESETFRLLSLSDSSKVILVSKMPAKTKYMLDASTAKITVNGKPAEFSDLIQYSIIHVKFELRKNKKEGIDIDGVATEIAMSPPQSP